MSEGKIVYDPKEDAKNHKNAVKAQTKKAVVYPQPSKPTEPPKPAATKKPAKAAKSTTPDKPDMLIIKEFATKLNKYGFIHIPKAAWSSLPFKIEERLTARIEGNNITIAATTENQPKTEKN